jgi:hypothetical protein
MSIEIRQMVVKTKLSEDAGGNKQTQQPVGLEPAELELLRKEILDACRRMIADSLLARKER